MERIFAERPLLTSSSKATRRMIILFLISNAARSLGYGDVPQPLPLDTVLVADAETQRLTRAAPALHLNPSSDRIRQRSSRCSNR